MSRAARKPPLHPSRRLSVSLSGCPAGLSARMRRLARDTLTIERHSAGKLEIGVVDGRTMAKLHKAWMNDASATDVLTFDLRDTPRRGHVDAQIVVCEAVARREARARKLDWQDELLRYVVHGCLHLCGYDDRRSADARRMHRRQEELLGRFL